MYAYFSRRRTLLFKGLLLLGTVWLTVAVLVLMENREKVEREQPSRRQALLFDPSAEEAAALAAAEAEGAGAAGDNLVAPGEDPRLPEPAAQFNVEDPLELVMDDGKSNPDQDDELVAKKGVKLYGELGKPVELPANLPAEVKKLVQEGWSKNAFNQYVSDLISVHRSLPDTRDQW